MKELLTSGAVGKIELEAQKKIHEEIQKRWKGLGLVNGLEGHLQETVATLFENQAKHLIKEATASDNSGSFETVVFPLIRRVFSKLLANDIVSVQAMNLPIGKLFFIKPVTSEREWFYDQNGQPVEGKHRGLMGYERNDRNQGGAVNNRYYLPDECISVLEQHTMYVVEGVSCYYDATTQKLYDINGNIYTPSSVVINSEVQASGDEVAYLVDSNNNKYYSTGTVNVSPAVTQYMRKTLYDLFYNDFLYDNSKGKVHITVGNTYFTAMHWNERGELVPFEGTATDADLPTNPMDGSISSLILEVSGFHSYNAGRLTGPDGNEMDTESFLASMKFFASDTITGGSTDSGSYAIFAKGEEIHFRVVTQKYGDALVHYDDICDANGKMYVELDLTKPISVQGSTVNGYIGVAPDAFDANTYMQYISMAWSSYDSLELETEMGEVSFQLTSITVSVEERKLRATWSPELAQDVAAFHNIDAEAELTAILSEQIAAEIDREILRDLRKAAPWQARWDYNGWQRIATLSTNYTQKDWNQTLMTKINQISAQIQKSTLRGGANFIVVSAEISAVLNDLEYFHVTDAQAEAEQYNMGIENIGRLQGRYNVIVDPYAPHWSLIMGHHGTSLLDTGYIYAPYIPMALTPTMYNPFNFAPVKGICTRYAKKLVNNRYYGAIKVDGLVYWNPNELR